MRYCVYPDLSVLLNFLSSLMLLTCGLMHTYLMYLFMCCFFLATFHLFMQMSLIIMIEYLPAYSSILLLSVSRGQQ